MKYFILILIFILMSCGSTKTDPTPTQQVYRVEKLSYMAYMIDEKTGFGYDKRFTILICYDENNKEVYRETIDN